MWLIWIGVVLIVLKVLEISVFATMSWWWIKNLALSASRRGHAQAWLALAALGGQKSQQPVHGGKFGAVNDVAALALRAGAMAQAANGKAIEADAVHEVATIETERLETVPAAASEWPPEYLTGLYRGQDGFVLLPDLPAIFSAQVTRPAAVS